MAGAVFFPQGGEDGVAGEHRGDQVADVEAYFDRRAVGFAVDVHQAAHALDLRVVGGFVLVGAGLPVAGNGGVDDTGVDGGDSVVAQSGAAQGAGGEVFQHYVGLFRQIQEKLLAFGGFQVKGYALDALGAFQEAGGQVIGGVGSGVGAFGAGEGAVAAHRVAAAGDFDFDDFGAQPGQAHGGKGPGEVDGDAQDANAG